MKRAFLDKLRSECEAQLCNSSQSITETIYEPKKNSCLYDLEMSLSYGLHEMGQPPTHTL